MYATILFLFNAMDEREVIGILASRDSLNVSWNKAMLLRHVCPPLFAKLIELVSQEAVASDRTKE